MESKKVLATKFKKDEAGLLAAANQEYDEDWKYIPEVYNESFYIIGVYDEDTHLIGYL